MKPAELVIGQYYFAAGCYIGWDDKLKVPIEYDNKVPMIKVFIYIGRNLGVHAEMNVIGDNHPNDMYYFQDPESYLRDGPKISFSTNDRAKVTAFAEDQLSAIIDTALLVERLILIKHGVGKS